MDCDVERVRTHRDVLVLFDRTDGDKEPAVAEETHHTATDRSVPVDLGACRLLLAAAKRSLQLAEDLSNASADPRPAVPLHVFLVLLPGLREEATRSGEEA